MRLWPFGRAENTTQTLSISDPALAAWFGVGPNLAGVPVNEHTALGVSAFWRGVMLISQTIAGLPLKTYRDIDGDTRQRVGSWLDHPGGPDGATPYEWKETGLLHLLLHGSAYGLRFENQGGAQIGAPWIHPLNVSPDWERNRAGDLTGRKVFHTTLANGQRKTYTQDQVTQVMGPTLDGLRGLSILSVARQSLGTTIAGDRAAANLFSNGGLIRGLVSLADGEDVDEDEAEQIKAGLDSKIGGWEHAGELAFVNRRLKFDPWTMSAEDAQFLGSRAFQIEEVARWLGVPPHLLMQTEKQTSWGTGVEVQNRGLSQYSLMGWTSRFEQRFSRTLRAPRFCEFDYAGLEKPTPEQEISLLIQQVEAKLLTIDEARKIRNLPPLTPEQRAELGLTPAGTPAGNVPANVLQEALT